MTLESKVDELIAAQAELIEAVNIKRAEIDQANVAAPVAVAARDEAIAAKDVAVGAAGDAEAAKDLAEAAKDLAEAAAASLPNATTAGPDKFLRTNPTGDGWVSHTAEEHRAALELGTAATHDVTTSDDDVTADRVLRTGAGPAQAFRRGNILGTVSQSSGIPTGAIIERGSNANGEYVRYADGTQICTGTVDLEYLNSAIYQKTWTFPAAFSVAPAAYGVMREWNPWPTGAPGYVVARATAGTTTRQFQYWGSSLPSEFTLANIAVLAIGRWF